METRLKTLTEDGSNAYYGWAEESKGVRKFVSFGKKGNYTSNHWGGKVRKEHKDLI